MAQPFRFRLQTLLRVRELHEREARRKVAAQRAEIARTDQLISDSFREIERQQNALRERLETPALNTLELTRSRAWIAHLRRTLAQQQLQKSMLLAELERRLETWRNARRQTQVLEKLRERKLAVWQRDRNLRDQAASDELAQQLHRRSGSSGRMEAADLMD